MENLVFNIKMTKKLTLYDKPTRLTGTTSTSSIWPHIFFKGEFICRVFPPANTNKGHSPHSCRAHHTPGCDTHCRHRSQPWVSLLVLLIFYPNNDVTSSNTVPAAWKLPDLQISISSLCLFWGRSCTHCTTVALSKAHQHFQGAHPCSQPGSLTPCRATNYSYYSNKQKPG